MIKNSVPKVKRLCEEAVQNRPKEPYIYLEFLAEDYHKFIKDTKPQLATDGAFRGVRGEIVSQGEGKVLVKYDARDLLKQLNPTITS